MAGQVFGGEYFPIIRERMAAADRGNPSRPPFAIDAHLNGVGVYLCIAHTDHAQMVTQRLGRGLRNGPRIHQVAQAFFENQPECLLPLGKNAFGHFDYDSDDARRLPVFSQYGGVVQVKPDLFWNAVSVQRQFLVLVPQRAACQSDFHDVVVEVGNLTPSFTHLGAKQLWMPGSGKNRIGVVVKHDAILAPEHDDRDRRQQDCAESCLKALCPRFDGS